jgi:phosphoadenosine phosphosulfate reductase
MQDFNALNREFERAAPQDVLCWAADTYGERLTLVTSFQPSGLVMMHMMMRIAPQVSIMTIDTGLLFPETYALIERWTQQFQLEIVRVCPAQTPQEQAQAHGDALWQRDPDLCCQLRKTIPLGEVLRGYDAWITGIRRDQAQTRQHSAIIAWDAKYNLVKLAPLVTWTRDQVWQYIHDHDLPYNPLHDQHYPSIGCYPCTRAVAAGEDERGGRWSGTLKTECGIHTH